jgi:hypothetical protein
MSIRSHSFAPFLIVLAACGSSAPADDTGDDQPTGPVYYGEVDRILNGHCVMCHSADADRLAPFSLATYDDAAAAAQTQPMAHAVLNRIMPPFYADDSGACQTFKDNPWLSDADMATLVDWSNGARAAGDVAAASPPPLALPALSQVDTTLDAGTDYTPDPALTDDYRCFLVDPEITADQFITAYQVKPGNPTAVHHVIVFSLPTAQAEAAAIEKDTDADGLGWPCIGGTGVAGTDMVGGWAPGSGANFMPAGTGIKIPGGRKMVLQLHYNLHHADGQPDRTTVELALASSVASEARIMGVPAAINLPPGQPDVTAVGTVRIPSFIDEVTVWGSAIHMHERGLAGTRLRETTSDTCMLDLVNWSFHWQHQYQYETPVILTGGDTLEITCHFDTTHDTTTVTWGEGTEDEMCIAFLYVTGSGL